MAAPNAETAMVENFPHLDSRLREVDLHGNLLPCVDVRVVSLLQCVFYEQQARFNSLQRRDKRMLNLKTKCDNSSLKLEGKYLESPLKLLELSRGECCANPPLLPLLRQDTVVPRVHLVRQPS